MYLLSGLFQSVSCDYVRYCIIIPLANGLVCVVWVGQHVSHTVLSNVFGVTSHAQVDTNMVSYHGYHC